MAKRITMEDVFKLKDQHMIDESKRLESFHGWPFKTGPCTKEKMAQAGFYCDGSEPTAVRCFNCLMEMEGFESTDIPFDEHKSNSTGCTFATLGLPQGELTLANWIAILQERQMNIQKERQLTRVRKMRQQIGKVTKALEDVDQTVWHSTVANEAP